MQVYASGCSDCELYMYNQYYAEPLNISSTSSRLGGRNSVSFSTKFGPLFWENKLGASYSTLRDLVVSSVTSSTSRTAGGVSLSAFRQDGMESIAAKISPPLSAAAEQVPENIPPKWDTPRWIDEMLIAEGFSPDVIAHGAVTLGDMMAADDNIKLSFVNFTTRKRSRPFAQGALRLATYARTAVSTNRFVTKSFKRNGKTLTHLAEDMRIQALCKAFALEVNALVGPEYSIDFIVTTCLQGTSASTTSSGGGEFISLEPYIGGAHVSGAYVKYNGNNSYFNRVIPDDKVNIAAQAFFHFTFERSLGTLLVCDLQGVGRVLTDPAIHTLDCERFRLTDTNSKEDGFKFFFSTHVCNDVCRRLKLQSNRSMFISGSFEYRELCPTMDNTVCCSNKICGRIMCVVSVKRSDEFPGCH